MAQEDDGDRIAIILSLDITDALFDERDDLMRRLAIVERKIASLDVLLPDPMKREALDPVLRVHRKRERLRKQPSPVPSPVGTPAQSRTGTLLELVETILRMASAPMAPTEIMRTIRQHPNEKLRRKALGVYTALNLLIQRGAVRRLDQGRYEFVTPR